MPYITTSRRGDIMQSSPPVTPGELNYKITKTCIDYARSKGTSYTTYNEIIGALECAKMEMYRRAVAPYEDTKITENGDVY